MAAKKKKTTDNRSLLAIVEEKAGESSLSGRNRAVLMAMRDEIADVLGRGYKWRVVWQALTETGRITMGYDTFRMHCRAMGLEAEPKSYTKGSSKPSTKKKGRG